ncbi:hypothetical protein [Empedobacter brevis]|uniref:hypothetical protein n=1 Tax=Empedobacter brevis TaxID=247 RepID=UPI0033427237
MNKNFTLKCMALFAFTFLGFKAQAQYYADGTILNATKSLIVDTDPTKGSGNETSIGSPGSTYTWTATSTFSGATPDFPNTEPGNTINDDNIAVVKWNPGAWPVSGGNPMDLIKDYTITVVENSTCPPAVSTDNTTNIDVKLVKADILKISTAASNVCYIGTTTPDVQIDLEGTPEATVNFTVISGGTPTTSAITFDVNGKKEIIITPTGGDIVVRIDDVVYTKTQPSLANPNFQTKTNGTDIAFNAGTTDNNIIKIVVGSAPKVSPIEF